MKQAGIPSLIGNTPLVRLERLFPGSGINFYAKLEGVSIGGSVKDRAAHSIISRAWARGEIGPGTTVIESSSGNMGIGLAQVCLYYGLPFICVVDPKATSINMSIMRAYGAQVVEVMEPDPATGEFLQARIHKVQELMRQIPGAFWTDQYSNQDNAWAHQQTFHEIFEELDGRLDVLFLSASTCGQVRGCSDYVGRPGVLPHGAAAVRAGKRSDRTENPPKCPGEPCTCPGRAPYEWGKPPDCPIGGQSVRESRRSVRESSQSVRESPLPTRTGQFPDTSAPAPLERRGFEACRPLPRRSQIKPLLRACTANSSRHADNLDLAGREGRGGLAPLGVAAAIGRACEMPGEERKRRMVRLQRNVLAEDVHGWVADFLDHARGDA